MSWGDEWDHVADVAVVDQLQAGSCLAAPAGQAYWGAGGTIGLALTYGYHPRCHAAAEPARTPS